MSIWTRLYGILYSLYQLCAIPIISHMAVLPYSPVRSRGPRGGSAWTGWWSSRRGSHPSGGGGGTPSSWSGSALAGSHRSHHGQTSWTPARSTDRRTLVRYFEFEFQVWFFPFDTTKQGACEYATREPRFQYSQRDHTIRMAGLAKFNCSSKGFELGTSWLRVQGLIPWAMWQLLDILINEIQEPMIEHLQGENSKSNSAFEYAVKVKRHRPSVVVDPRNVVHAL